MSKVSQQLVQSKAGSKIYGQGKNVTGIAVLVKGSVTYKNEYLKATVSAGEILGAYDTFEGKYTADYTAAADCVLFMLPVTDETSLEAFLDSNEDYRGMFVMSMNRHFVRCHNASKKLLAILEEERGLLGDHYNYLKKLGVSYKDIPDFEKNNSVEEYDLVGDTEDTEFYLESSTVPSKSCSEYYKASSYMAMFMTNKLRVSISDACEDIKTIIKAIRENLSYMYRTGSNEHLLQREKDLVEKLSEKGKADQGLTNRLHKAKDEIITVLSVLDSVNHAPEGVTPEMIEQDVSAAIEESLKIQAADSGEAVADEKEDENLSKELLNSLQTILYYSGLDKGKCEEFVKLENNFEESRDRLDTGDSMRRLKKEITAMYFDIYEACVYKWIKDKNAPLPVRLFLFFGYMDERLLSFDQLKALANALKKTEGGSVDGIYYMPEWLEAVYMGEKEPSRNSFEQDYPDFLRDQKKRGEITPQQMDELMKNHRQMLHFEIHNMFMQVNKVSNGQIMTYVPLLYQDQIFGDIPKIFMGRKSVNDLIEKLGNLDITAFAREVTFYDEAVSSEKQQIMTLVYPDVIITPVYGMSGVMWQEIEGKKRSSPGRIIFPVLEEGDREKIMTTMVGRLHWEYVRREMGAEWNNIAVKSLTSEYSDYLQYYRKNRDLSEEIREKVKLQLQKSRNNFRDAFVMDYVNWIQYESGGIMKLNKVAREIMATYCPFNRETRDSLMINAMYEKAMFRQKKRFSEQAHTWELRIKKMENHGQEIPEEFYDTLEYYTQF